MSHPSEKSTASRQQLGKLGEELAARFLANHGHTIIARNYRCQAGEIDIISRDSEYLVFTEVKTRRTTLHGKPSEAVTPYKQRQICRSADVFLSKNEIDCDIRFDIITIFLPKNKPPQIEHIADAFDYIG